MGSEGAEPALTVTGLSKSYNGVRAVAGVDLTVRAGEIHGLLGANGAGKTTLLRMLLGLATPDAGSFRMLDAAGFVDAPRFYPYLSGRRNLELLARLDGAGTGDVTRALGEVGLTSEAERLVSGYSAGMRQRLGLAGALLHSPKLLLLDEPTTSLDLTGARDVRAHVKGVAEEGVAVLLSSHDMAEVEELCTSLTILHRGVVVFAGTMGELRARVPVASHRLSTSDDRRARELSCEGVAVADGLDITATQESLDRYVIALGRAGIAVRALARREVSLASLFLELTSGDPPTTPHEGDPVESSTRVSMRGALRVAGVELAKLRAQGKVWTTLAVCVVAPFGFVVATKLAGTLPEDTPFGRFVTTSGLAVPLLILGFAGAWAFPVLTSIVAGDLFSSEDRYGTWPTILTRTPSRSAMFAGKTLAAFAFSMAAVSLLGIAAVVAGMVLVGRQPLISLSGTELAPDHALGLVTLAWASALPPALGFTGLALMVSVLTRSSAAGVGLPVLAGLAMQLYTFLNGPDVVRRALLGTAFGAWHGLLAEPPFAGTVLEGCLVSAAYLVVSLSIAYRVIMRRDIGS